jgi:deoxyribodipyrimidine photo-lyase
MVPNATLVWFRRDLRNHDHAALAEATRRSGRVHCAFVFDREILDALPSRRDRRVEFIRESLVELDAALRSTGGGMIVRVGRAVDEIPRLAQELGVSAVFANRDYEPQARRRDAAVADALARGGIGFATFKDQAVLEFPEVATANGRPHTVFTPYRNAWRKRLTEDDLAPYRVDPAKLAAAPRPGGIPTLAQLGFVAAGLREHGVIPGMRGARRRFDDFLAWIGQYREQRDFPARAGVSGLSVHLRFGTIAIRELVAAALSSGAAAGREGPSAWLDELIWRDFYFMILECFPHVAERAFKPEFDRIAWETGEDAERLFAAWCAGRTGFPLVDAAMRQLNSTGYMHNRLRMVTASFLTKDLGIDWRRGEACFAERLLDFDLSANNGGWQWAASSGCDAQPYFRIFNPVTQSARFDPHGEFIRRHLPELATVPDRYIHAPWRMPPGEQEACGVIVGRDTPAPVVDHDAARRRTLARYAAIRRSGG